MVLAEGKKQVELIERHNWPVASCPVCHTFPQIFGIVQHKRIRHQAGGWKELIEYRSELNVCPACDYTFEAVIIDRCRHYKKRFATLPGIN